MFYLKIRNLWQKDNKKLTQNFTSLMSVRIINLLQPLIVLPYLTRTLGPEKFGLIAFAQAFIEYFSTFIDFGFDLTATRDISKNINNKNKINQIFSSVLTAKNLILLVSLIIILTVVFSNEKFSQNWQLFLICSSILVGNTLFPLWFFQGIEKMKYISYFNIIAKLFFTICIFIFIRQESDYLLVPLFISLGNVSIGIIAICIILGKFKVKFRIVSLRKVYFTLADSSAAFISNLAPNLYNNSSTFLLGLFTTSTITGYYSGTIKIINFFNTVIQIISRTFFPHLSKKRSSFKDFIKIIVGTGLILSIMVFIFRKFLVHVLLGNEFAIVNSYLLVFSISIFQMAFNSGFGRTFLLIINKDNLLRNINVIVSILGFTIIFGGIYLFGIWGVFFGLIIIRFIFSVIYYYYYRKLNPNK